MKPNREPTSTNFREHFYLSCPMPEKATSAADRWMSYAAELERQNALLTIALKEAVAALSRPTHQVRHEPA